MRRDRTSLIDQQRVPNVFADWVASEDHFGNFLGTPTNIRVDRERSRYTPVHSHVPVNQRRGEPSAAPTAHGRTFTQIISSDALAQPPVHTDPSRREASVSPPAPTAPEPAAPARVQAASASTPEQPDALPIATAPVEPSTSSEGFTSGIVSLPPPSGPAANTTPPVEYPSPQFSASPDVAVRAAIRSQPSPARPPRTRSQVGRDSYKLLWREYLALTAEELQLQKQKQRQQAAASRGWNFLTKSSSSNSGSHKAISQEMSSTPAQSTILQGPLPYDQPKGLAKLLLPILCPPTDFIDMQRLTKDMVRVVIALSIWVAAIPYILAPAWLWLLRHELFIGHKGDAAAVAVLGLVVIFGADAVRDAVARADLVRRAGVFTASDRTAYQTSLGRPAAATCGAPPPGVAATPTATAATAAAGGSRVTSAAARSHAGVASAGMNGFVTSPAAATAAADPLVSQVKRHIIALERVVFGHELTEADISRDALASRVYVLCRDVGVPNGGPGGGSSRPTLAELDRQLLAVADALGVSL